MGSFLLMLVVGLNLVLLVLVARSGAGERAPRMPLNWRKWRGNQRHCANPCRRALLSATADMATRLESTKGDLRQEVTDRLGQGFTEIRTAVEGQLAGDGESRHRICGRPAPS